MSQRTNRSITAHYVGLVLPEDLPPDVKGAVRQFATERGADYALIKGDESDQGTLLFLHKKVGRLSFNSGVNTISAKLMDIPVRKLDLPQRNPMNFFRRRYPNGVRGDRIIEFDGSTFSPDTLARLTTLAARLMDPTVRLKTLVENGDIEMMDVSSIANARSHLTQEERDWEGDHLPDLDGPLTIRYQKHVDGNLVPDGPFKDVTIVGRPGDLEAKRKHYWIYSSPGFGKTTATRLELVNKYKAAFLPHPQNAVNVSNNAQFLIMDEVGPNRRIPMEQLKGLTCGDASTSYLNRKHYGQSYVPRKDVQFIFLSSYSPYNVYAKQRTKRIRRMDSVDMLSIEERFNIIRLDGDNFL